MWRSWPISVWLAINVANAAVTPDDDAISIPEAYVRKTDAPYCVLRAEVEGFSASQRRHHVIHFIEKSYDLTMKWRDDFLVAGVDYVEFKYFYLITFDDCARVSPVVDKILSLYSTCNSSDEACGKIDIAFDADMRSRLVQPLRKRDPQQPILKFDQYRGPENLPKCTISVPIAADLLADFRAFGEFMHNLRELFSKFRMPIIEATLINGQVFILLSRQCDSKSKIYDEMLGLLTRQYPGADQRLGAPNFSPDVSEYRFSETGTRW